MDTNEKTLWAPEVGIFLFKPWTFFFFNQKNENVAELGPWPCLWLLAHVRSFGGALRLQRMARRQSNVADACIAED